MPLLSIPCVPIRLTEIPAAALKHGIRSVVQDSNRDRFLVGFQATAIQQVLMPFKSHYSGANSLQSISQGRLSDTYTLYLGARLSKQFQVFVNPEMARGGGIGEALGLAGFTNGDVIRNPSLGQGPYIGRAFGRWILPLSKAEESVEKGENQIAGKQPVERLVITGGKLGVNDIFDTNVYSNSTRTQFMNWDLLNDPAYDYAADTRGYSEGVVAEWITPSVSLRAGSFFMPRVANGIDLDAHTRDSRGDQAELELHPSILRGRDRATAKYLVYRNVATMGNYAQALSQMGAGVPDITATRQRGRIKYGFGINISQPLSDNGQTGLFTRIGWNDGRTESFAYTEAEDHFSFGAQLSGVRWHRPSDLIGLAISSNGLSSSHRAYLAAGGLGFLLGDGRLSYGRENVVEGYYNYGLSPTSTVTLGTQVIQNPGYNRDRGPVPTFSLRFHFEF